MDSSTAYKAVMHDVHPEVDSLLGMYEIGAMRRLNFKSVTGVALSKEGLIVVSVEDNFQAWVRYLCLITEIQNALYSDYSLRDEPLNQAEVGGEITPKRVYLVIEAHHRFLRGAVDALTGPELQNLWLISTGLFATDEHSMWMEHQISGLHQQYQGLQSTPDLLGGFLESAKEQTPLENRDRRLSALSRLCEQIVSNDASLVAELIEAARRVVRTFEVHEASVVARGVSEVMAALTLTPSILRRYYETMQQLLPPSPQDLSDRHPYDADGMGAYTPGHGGRVVHRPRKP